jgi:ABC-type Mn2+/Zn2+ transport system ATPase subunit
MSFKYFPPQIFKERLEHGKTIQVGSQTGSNDALLPEADELHFSIRRDASLDRVVIRDGAGPSATVVDWHLLKTDELPAELPVQHPVYVADSTKLPRWVLGFDPSVPDLWTVENRGLSLEIKDVSVLFNRARSGLKDINLTIGSGEFVGLYGASGSGKTTLVELVLNLVQPNAGQIQMDQGLKRVAYLPQQVALPANATGREILNLCASDRGVSLQDRVYEKTRLRHVLSVSRLVTGDDGADDELLDKRIGELSGGQYRRLCLAAALCTQDLGLLIADEPTSGLDPTNEQEVFLALRRVSRFGITVVVVTHAASALKLFDRVVVLRRPQGGGPSHVSFSGLWHEDSWGDYPVLKERSTDLEKLAFLADWKSALAFPEAVGLVREIPQPEFGPDPAVSPVNPWSQFGHWCRSLFISQVREWRVFAQIMVLSALCVVMLQLGVFDPAKLIALFCIAAPWLAATYATLFSAGLLRFFAFESFAGLRASAFVSSLFTALIPAAALIGCLFAVGLMWDPNCNRVVNMMANRKVLGGVVKGYAPGLEVSTRPQGPALRSPGPYKEFLSLENYQTHYPVPNSPTVSDSPTPTVSSIRLFGSMAFISIVGAALGVLMTAMWRIERVAMMACVILFVIFMVFSRANINHAAYLGPLAETGKRLTLVSDTNTAHRVTEWQELVPIWLSYFSLPRYAFNCVCYSAERTRCLVIEFLVLGLFAGGSLVTATLILGRTKTIWILMTRAKTKS